MLRLRKMKTLQISDGIKTYFQARYGGETAQTVRKERPDWSRFGARFSRLRSRTWRDDARFRSVSCASESWFYA